MRQRNSCKNRHCEAAEGSRSNLHAWRLLRSTLRVSLAMTCCLLLVAVSGCGTSFHFKKLQQMEKETPAITAAKQELRVGERLTYEIKWMGVPVGIAVFS